MLRASHAHESSDLSALAVYVRNVRSSREGQLCHLGHVPGEQLALAPTNKLMIARRRDNLCAHKSGDAMDRVNRGTGFIPRKGPPDRLFDGD
jgi:hypothetical protein